MSSIFALLKDSDGKYHYGSAMLLTEQLSGQLSQIIVKGDGTLPPNSCEPRTQEQHKAWLDELARNGFSVSIKPIKPR